MIRLFFISVIFSFSSKAQTWQTIPLSLYNPTQIQYLHWDKGDPTTSFKQHFKINKFDNSLWGMHDSKVMRLDNNGIFQLWDESTTNLFQLGDTYADINFSSTHTFLVSQFTRLFKFDGAAWSILSNADKGLNLAMDSDTLWVSKFNENYLKITNATNINFGSMSYPRRMASKNGFTFFSSSLYLGGLSKLTEPTFTFYNPTVNTYYLDYENYDFKFSTVSDTLFTSGNRGFSLAINGVFVDTITKYNTTNMPDLAITEFEFDSQGNIWAVFAPPSTNGVFNNERIGYLDRSTNTWSQFYDETNSPIDFPRVSIEIDTNDNLWVANILNLHVLNSGNLPQWLSTIDLTKTKPFVHVYPNPSKGKIQIEASFEITHFTVHDLLGKEIMKGKNVSEINLPKGVYIISLFGTNGEQAKEKVLIE